MKKYSSFHLESWSWGQGIWNKFHLHFTIPLFLLIISQFLIYFLFLLLLLLLFTIHDPFLYSMVSQFLHLNLLVKIYYPFSHFFPTPDAQFGFIQYYATGPNLHFYTVGYLIFPFLTHSRAVTGTNRVPSTIHSCCFILVLVMGIYFWEKNDNNNLKWTKSNFPRLKSRNNLAK